MEKYGVENQFQREDVKEKIKADNLEKYGVEFNSQRNDMKKKIIETCLEKYGVEYPLQNEEIKEKVKKTCLERYGVEHVMHDPKILSKCIKSLHSNKTYTLPSGKMIDIQGYENFALDYLFYDKGWKEEEFCIGVENVPLIKYTTSDDKERKHFVDIFIPKKHFCIEVKSRYTFDINLEKNLAKMEAAKKMGLKYQIWVYNSKDERIEKIS